MIALIRKNLRLWDMESRLPYLPDVYFFPSAGG